MNERTAFLDAIRAQPADDALRLVFADWLQEQDEPRDHFHAELIRFQCGLAVLKHGHPSRCHAYQRRPSAGPQCPRCALDRDDRLYWQGEANRLLTPPFLLDRCLFRRGFIEQVVCDLVEWETDYAELLAAHPVRKLALGIAPGACLEQIARLTLGVEDIAFFGPVSTPHADGLLHFTRAGHARPPALFLRRNAELAFRRWWGTDPTSTHLLNRTALTHFRRPRR